MIELADGGQAPPGRARQARGLAPSGSFKDRGTAVPVAGSRRAASETWSTRRATRQRRSPGTPPGRDAMRASSCPQSIAREAAPGTCLRGAVVTADPRSEAGDRRGCASRPGPKSPTHRISGIRHSWPAPRRSRTRCWSSWGIGHPTPSWRRSEAGAAARGPARLRAVQGRRAGRHDRRGCSGSRASLRAACPRYGRTTRRGRVDRASRSRRGSVSRHRRDPADPGGDPRDRRRHRRGDRGRVRASVRTCSPGGVRGADVCGRARRLSHAAALHGTAVVAMTVTGSSRRERSARYWAHDVDRHDAMLARHDPAIAVHGGAFEIPRDEWLRHREGCLAAAQRGWQVLEDGAARSTRSRGPFVSSRDRGMFGAGRGRPSTRTATSSSTPG